MPAWIEELIKQTPVLGVALAIGYFAFKVITEQHKAHLEAIYAKQGEELTRLVEVYDKVLVSKDAEIARLIADKESILKERDGLLKQLKDGLKKT